MVSNKAFLLLQVMPKILKGTAYCYSNLGQHAVAYKHSLSYGKHQIIYFHRILYPLTEEEYLHLFKRNATQCICWGVGLPDKITYNPQKMLCILVSHAYFNHSTKCNKLWCLSNWKTKYKPSLRMCACNRTQPPGVQPGHPQPEQMLQLACQSVLHKVSLNWPKTPLSFSEWKE